MKVLCATAMATVLLAGPAAFAQEKSADNMALLLEKVRADKKLVVATNMRMTEPEAAAFWPVYDAYQEELAALNSRIRTLITNYAELYNQEAVTDDKAKQLLDEALAIEGAELDLRKSYVSKFGKVLPASKVARYYQIENKIRSAVKADLAGAIPLVQ